ncbi:hypothetical protein C7445_103211 [Alicyclobacillus sacchari]|uniref:Spore coat protein W n=1 Tax=Alicyclobacillus sacchari TaxID=392010 RepID=A0A4R8LTQ1_9BACL|nr:hypothetical protein [Alicyclobacillus sacchari]TDY50165.1 hypothetical protein C7445_103211 [Alicyclobacillus sacchari]GMA57460.1 hypothetical protein GCM10025858_19630 [Alicyclobacillus sacchari]
MNDMDDVTKNLTDLLIEDVFRKHNISKEKRKPISAEEREKLRDLINTLQAQVENFLQTQKPVPNEKAEAKRKK